MTTITKEQFRKKVGKKWWLSDQQLLAAKLDYASGIGVFDEIFDGKTLKEIDAVIHLEKYPKGLLFKIARGFGGFKTHLFPVSKNEIKNILLLEDSNNNGELYFNLVDGNKIEFKIKPIDIWDVNNYLKDTQVKYKIEQVKNLLTTDTESVASSLPSMVRNELEKMSAQKQDEFIEEYKRKRKSIGLAYLFLLVIFTLHYGYLKKWGLQIVFWLTGGGFGIWWLIDLFRLPNLVQECNKDIAIDVMRNLKVISS